VRVVRPRSRGCLARCAGWSSTSAGASGDTRGRTATCYASCHFAHGGECQACEIKWQRRLRRRWRDLPLAPEKLRCAGADVYLDDIQKHFGNFRGRAIDGTLPEVTAPVYVDKDPGGAEVALTKKREGLLVIFEGGEVIVARDLSFARTKTSGHGRADANAEEITVKVDAVALPGLRLTADKEPLVFGIAPVRGVGDRQQLGGVRDMIVGLLRDA